MEQRKKEIHKKMKIEIEIDDKELTEKIIQRVVDKLIEDLKTQLSYDFNKEIRKKITSWFDEWFKTSLDNVMKTHEVNGKSFLDLLKQRFLNDPYNAEWLQDTDPWPSNIGCSGKTKIQNLSYE